MENPSSSIIKLRYHLKLYLKEEL